MRCATCGREFIELKVKGAALWNTKLPHERATDVVEHVPRGNCFKETEEVIKVPVRRRHPSLPD